MDAGDISISSYQKNNYAEVFKAIIKAYPPVNAVELGVLNGYSAIAIAEGIKEAGLSAHLDAYDLFDGYPYNHAKQEDVQKRINEAGLQDVITLYKEDAFIVHSRYPDNSLYLLHIDLSNTGQIVRKILEVWHPKMVIGGVILFEGGSQERDKVGWMLEYNKEPIKPEIENNLLIKHNYVYGTYELFPSLTMLLKKWPNEQGYN